MNFNFLKFKHVTLIAISAFFFVACKGSNQELGGIHVGNPFQDEGDGQKPQTPIVIDEPIANSDGMREFSANQQFKVYLPASLQRSSSSEKPTTSKIDLNQAETILSLESPEDGDIFKVFAVTELGDKKSIEDLEALEATFKENLPQISFEDANTSTFLSRLSRWEDEGRFYELRLILSPYRQILVSEIVTTKKQAMIKLSHQVERIRFDLAPPKIYRMDWSIFKDREINRIQFRLSGFDQFSKDNLNLEFHLQHRLSNGDLKPMGIFRSPLKRVEKNPINLAAWFDLEASSIDLWGFTENESLEVNMIKVSDKVGNATLLIRRDGLDYYFETELLANLDESDINDWSWWSSDHPALIWPSSKDSSE